MVININNLRNDTNVPTGNTMILIALFKDKNLHTRSNKFIRNLAFADLCVGFWTMSVTFASMINQAWVREVTIFWSQFSETIKSLVILTIYHYVLIKSKDIFRQIFAHSHFFQIFDVFGDQSLLYVVTCNFSAFLDNLLLTTRMWTLAASSVDRYILICHQVTKEEQHMTALMYFNWYNIPLGWVQIYRNNNTEVTPTELFSDMWRNIVLSQYSAVAK